MDIATQMNSRVRAQKSSDIRKFNAEVSSIDGIINLTLGEPDFATPTHIKQAAIRSIQADESHYLPSRGLPDLREAASNYLSKQYCTEYDPDTQVLITAGATGGIYAGLNAILNPGDSVFIPTPIFPLYVPITQMTGAVPVFMDTSSDDFVLSPERLETAILNHQTTAKLLVLNFPSNPTGVTYTRAQLEALASVVRKYNLLILSDEVYSEFTYTGKHVSMGEILPERTIVLNSLSKSHAMTGWRIGLAAGPADIMNELAKVSEFTVTCLTNAAQYAAVEALRNGQHDVSMMKEAYRHRRDFMTNALRDAGLKATHPQGAFYLFVKLPEQYTSSWDFAYSLAREAGVAVIPGASFYDGGEGYVRLSYAASMEDLKEAGSRIKSFMSKNQNVIN